MDIQYMADLGLALAALQCSAHRQSVAIIGGLAEK
jgi:hypothetical protein